MSHKSFATMEQHVCAVCCKAFDTNAILLDTRLQERFDYRTITGYALCPEHEEMRKKGYIAIIEVKNDPQCAKDGLKIEEANRTGVFCHIGSNTAKRFFNVPLDAEKTPVAFAQEGLIELIAGRLK
jgi:hypothetical protein